ncbi:MAG: hypothetical protein HZA31_08250 [Opitutae bacterium]|nr:hypothetical protein [Opitutae bacterium]
MLQTDMPGRIFQLLWWGLTLALSTVALRAENASLAPVPVASPKKIVNVVVIPMRDQIGSPVLYILRRGLKEAIDRKADAVVLDMKTPGGALDTTFEIMEALAKFPGKTITYVNTEAMSAGAFISATTEEIWFAPGGIIGAAAPVQSGGQEIDATMKQKLISYLTARVRAVSEGKGYRGQVVSAMIDADEEFRIGKKLIKGKGKLLSLTATEAMATYGTPPQALLGAGIAKTVDELLAKKYGEGGYVVKKLEVTWSEQVAVWLNAISPILLGLGLLALFIEFKTPGFGFFGIAGIALLALVFLSSYVAGLSGHEPVLVFALGGLLVMVELFFFPGVVVVALTGLALMMGALVYAMADVWPNEPLTFSGELFVQPLISLGLGLVTAVGLGLLVARLLPKGWFFSRLTVAETATAAAQVAGGAPEAAAELASLVGARGVAATGLFPSGQVEIAGRRYEARVAVGTVPAGATIVVVGVSDFGLIVEAVA